jgi:hypothetical protein
MLDAGAEGVLMGVENTRRREPAAGVREGVAALLGGSTFGVAAEVDGKGSEASEATTVSPANISALPKRRCVDDAFPFDAPMTAADRNGRRSPEHVAAAARPSRALARRSPRVSSPSPRARPVRARSPFVTVGRLTRSRVRVSAICSPRVIGDVV